MHSYNPLTGAYAPPPPRSLPSTVFPFLTGSQPKISDLGYHHAIAAEDQQVFGFDIIMDDTLVVEVL